MTTRLLTLHDVTAITALSRSAVYALVAESRFPRPIRIGGWAVREVLSLSPAGPAAAASSPLPDRDSAGVSRNAAVFYEVEYTNEFESWWDELSARAQDNVSRVVDRLVIHGPQLSYPRSSAVRQSRHGRMRELRIQSGGRPIRVFYAFDPRRTAILLSGGHKTQGSRFNDYYVPRADMIYDRYLNELRREGLIRSYEPHIMTHRPWSELTKHWSPERKAANARAGAKLDAEIRRLQAQARKEGRHPGDPPSADSSSRRPQTPIYPVESGLEPERDFDRESAPSR